jgi:hypothetical protein
MTVGRLLCLWLLASPTTAPTTAATTAPARPIVISKDNPVVDRVMFDHNHQPDGMPKLRPGEAALTRSSYECRAGVRYEEISKKQVGDHWHVVEKIHDVDVETSLTDTIYLPMMAPTLLRAHEEGHREMNEQIYQGGDAVVRAAAQEIMSHTWESDGPTAEGAAKAATDLAVQQMCKTYLAATANRAARLGNIYDRLTDHGRNQLYVANAIRLSFLEEKRYPATNQGELLHPTTSVSK